MRLTGGCHRGAIRYAVTDEPFHETTCDCTDCRRVTGAASVAWFSVRRALVEWSGMPARDRSSPSVWR